MIDDAPPHGGSRLCRSEKACACSMSSNMVAELWFAGVAECVQRAGGQLAELSVEQKYETEANKQQAPSAEEYVVKLEDELQRICDDIFERSRSLYKWDWRKQRGKSFLVIETCFVGTLSEDAWWWEATSPWIASPLVLGGHFVSSRGLRRCAARSHTPCSPARPHRLLGKFGSESPPSKDRWQAPEQSCLDRVLSLPAS